MDKFTNFLTTLKNEDPALIEAIEQAYGIWFENEFRMNDPNVDYSKSDKLYQIFKDTYTKQTGTSWDETKFSDKARDWTFYGDENGYIAVRSQNSGLIKLTGAAGSPRSILVGLDELIAKNQPIWGAVSDNMTSSLKKKGFTVFKGMLYFPIIKTLVSSVGKYMFGNAPVKVNMDASIEIDYDDVGTAKKYLIANDLYLKTLLNMPNIPDSVKTLVQKII